MQERGQAAFCAECMIAETDQPVMSEVKIKVDMAEDPEGHPECDASPSSLVSSLKRDKIPITVDPLL